MRERLPELAAGAGIPPFNKDAMLHLERLLKAAPQILAAKPAPTVGSVKTELKKINDACRRFLASTRGIYGDPFFALAEQMGLGAEEEMRSAGKMAERFYQLQWEVEHFAKLTEEVREGFGSNYAVGSAPAFRKKQMISLCSRFFADHTRFKVSAAPRSRFSKFVHLLFDVAGHPQDDLSRLIRDVVREQREYAEGEK